MITLRDLPQWSHCPGMRQSLFKGNWGVRGVWMWNTWYEYFGKETRNCKVDRVWDSFPSWGTQLSGSWPQNNKDISGLSPYSKQEGEGVEGWVGECSLQEAAGQGSQKQRSDWDTRGPGLLHLPCGTGGQASQGWIRNRSRLVSLEPERRTGWGRSRICTMPAGCGLIFIVGMFSFFVCLCFISVFGMFCLF